MVVFDNFLLQGEDMVLGSEPAMKKHIFPLKSGQTLQFKTGGKRFLLPDPAGKRNQACGQKEPPHGQKEPTEMKVYKHV